MMAGMQRRSGCLTCTAAFFLLIFLPVLSLSAEGEGLEGYHHLITRSRQETGWTNNGTEIFLAPEVKGEADQYSDEELGNYVVKRHSHVRKVHVCPRITGDLEANHDLRLGVVEVEDGAGVREIDIQVDGDGDISGHDLFIGGVLLDRNADVDTVKIKTNIQGDIDAK